MAQNIVWILLASIPSLLSGCVVVDVEDCPPAVVGPDDSTIAEIDAAAKLFSDAQKRDVYLGIAQRPWLSCAAQVHLARQTHDLFSDLAKEQVLLALIENPCMCDTTKAQILKDLHRLFSDSAKRRILDAFNKRAQPPVPVPQEAMPEGM
jgi:hypothetical protein